MKKRCNLVSHINNVLLGVLGELGGGVHPFPLSAYIPTTDMPCPARGGGHLTLYLRFLPTYLMEL